MRTSLIALGFLALGLAQCSGDRGLFVGDERPDAGEGGEGNTSSGGSESGGASGSESGGASGSESRGGNGADAGEPGTGGGETSGGSENRGGSGSGAEAGEPSTGGVAGTAAKGGSDAGGSAGEGGTGTGAHGGMAGSGAEAGSGTAARGGMNDGGRAGSSNAGAGGGGTVDCNALAREYIERLALAQQCSPILTVEQCTIEIPDEFQCPCPTYVNPAREGDIRRLNQILEYRTHCAWACPAIVCPDPKRGTCSADAIVAGNGRCTPVL